MKKGLLFIFICIFSYTSVHADETTDTCYLNTLNVKNKHLYVFLDSIIAMRDESESSKFIYFNIRFGAKPEKKDLIYIRAYYANMDKGNIQGGFYYRGNSFVVSGNVLDKSIFEKTGNKQLFEFKTLDSDILVTDAGYDPHLYWACRYKDNVFKLLLFDCTSGLFDIEPFDHIDEEYGTP